MKYTESGKAAEVIAEDMLSQGKSEMEIIERIMRKLNFSEETAAGIYHKILLAKNAGAR